VVRTAGQRYERRNARDEGAAAILLREIRERVALCDDLVTEIIQRRETSRAQGPVIRRRGRGRAERPA